jgi:hypothetical protein
MVFISEVVGNKCCSEGFTRDDVFQIWKETWLASTFLANALLEF